jgi:hypothetical protein
MNVQKVMVVLMVALAASAWVAYAEHPNAQNLRRAIRDTWPLL